MQGLSAVERYVLKLDQSQLVPVIIIQPENKPHTTRLSFSATKLVKVNRAVHYVPMTFPQHEAVQLKTDINFAFLNFDFSLHELGL